MPAEINETNIDWLFGQRVYRHRYLRLCSFVVRKAMNMQDMTLPGRGQIAHKGVCVLTRVLQFELALPVARVDVILDAYDQSTDLHGALPTEERDDRQARTFGAGRFSSCHSEFL